jgi:hypothetical protein
MLGALSRTLELFCPGFPESGLGDRCISSLDGFASSRVELSGPANGRATNCHTQF